MNARIEGIPIDKLKQFDLAEYLETEEDLVAYLNMVLEDGDPSELAHALGVCAKARGMSEVARAAGISREALYKALRPGAKPRFDTIVKVTRALGCKLVVAQGA